ncbi:uncharacterized protein UHOD_11934 [Ustilago sp. UG-2017b]|nr:uncharacterized protein UHOD_11934 [Ustilago sp. UG-2017b]
MISPCCTDGLVSVFWQNILAKLVLINPSEINQNPWVTVNPILSVQDLLRRPCYNDLVDAAPKNVGDNPNFDISMPPPHPIPSDVLVSSLSTFSNRASPSQPNGYKCKHINVEQKRDSLAEAFYRRSIESLSIRLKLAQERTKQGGLQLQHECEERLCAQERECKERVRLEDRNVFIEMMCMMVTQQRGGPLPLHPVLTVNNCQDHNAQDCDVQEKQLLSTISLHLSS